MMGYRVRNGLGEGYEREFWGKRSNVIFKSVVDPETRIASKEFTKADLVNWYYTGKSKEVSQFKKLNSTLKEITHLQLWENWINNNKTLKLHIFSSLMSKVTQKAHIWGFKVPRKQLERVFIS